VGRHLLLFWARRAPPRAADGYGGVGRSVLQSQALRVVPGHVGMRPDQWPRPVLIMGAALGYSRSDNHGNSGRADLACINACTKEEC